MFFILSKILHFLISPFSWILILLIASFIWKKKSRKLRIWSVILLFFFGNGFILHEVELLWETPVTNDSELPKNSIGVVLGGYAYFNPKIDRVVFRESSDRLMQGLRLLKTNKVDRLVLSGGSGYVLHPEIREASYVSRFLKDLGFKKRHILIDSNSRNTYQNAIETKALLEENGLIEKPLVLITSASHMRRSVACFEKAGMTVIPYSTDMHTGDRSFNPQHLLIPSAHALHRWQSVMHEWIGFITYWIMGYI